MGDDCDAQFAEGIDCFNRGAFFDAHEAWEQVWLRVTDDSRTFYQGLIQVAVCLHHFGRGNTRGARKLYLSSTRYLQPFRPTYRGIDLDLLLDELTRCCDGLLAGDEPAKSVRLDRQSVPRIRRETRCGPIESPRRLPEGTSHE